MERTADAVASLDAALKRVEKKLDRLLNLSGERHVVIGERLAAIEKTGKAVSRSLEGLTAVVKTNNELARQSHQHVVNDLGLVKARVTKVESDIEAKRERNLTAGRSEKV